MYFQVKGLTQAQLQSMATPQLSVGGQSEAVAWTFYDTGTYVSAATTNLPFFNTARANRQATNLNTPGQLPEPQYFQIMWFGLNLLITPAATAWTDAQALLQGGTSGPPTWRFTLADKVYGPFPLQELHASGGIVGFGTQTSQAYANSGYGGHGDAWQDGAIIIPPQQGFRVDLDWDTAQTLSGNTLLQVVMRGTLHRRVL